MFNTIKCLFTPREKKIAQLKTKAIDYYYTILINTISKCEGVKIPVCIIEEQVRKQAIENAKRDLELVIAENRLNQCYKKLLSARG